MNIFHKLKDNKLFQQIFKFGIVGGIAFIIDYGIMVISKELLGFSILLSAGLGFTISVIFNYIASVKWVFDVNKEKSEKLNFILFVVLSIVGLGLNELILWICIEKFAIYNMIGKVIATGIVMVFNFITRKLFLE